MRFLLVLPLLFLLGIEAFAFPDNVRHGYFSCTACHVSPSGGGVLTPYGRSLSAELMSSWGTSKTAGFLFSDNENEKRNPPWFRAQGFLKAVQTYRNTAKIERATLIRMQGDLEAGVDLEKYAAIVAVGFRSRGPTEELNELFSRRHYFLYRFSDEWSARIGKFLFSFGLNMPDHITATRRGLGWDQGTESYNLETNYQQEKISTTLTLISNSPEEYGVKKDKGLAITSNYFLGERSKAGLSFYSAEQETHRRWVAGPQWVLAFTDKIFLESEIFWQRKEQKIAPMTQQNGYATFHRLGYETSKGVIPFVQLDRSDLDDTDVTQRADSYGIGLQWLPYSHFEILSFVGKEKSAGLNPTDFAWIMMNIYL